MLKMIGILITLLTTTQTAASEYFNPYFELDKGYSRYADADSRSLENFEIIGGIKLTSFLALEASYIKMGAIAYEIDEVLVARDVDTNNLLIMDGVSKYSNDPNAYTLGAVLSIPFSSKNDLTLKYGEYEIKETELLEFVNNEDGKTWNRTDESNPYMYYKGDFYGLGWNYKFKKGLDIRLKYSKYITERPFGDIEVFSVGLLFSN